MVLNMFYLHYLQSTSGSQDVLNHQLNDDHKNSMLVFHFLRLQY